MDHFRFANGSRAKMGEKTVHRYVQKGTFVIISKNLRMLYLDCERCGEPGGLVRCCKSVSRFIVLCPWERHSTFAMPISSQEYKRAPTKQTVVKPEEIDEGGLR